jgi:hypothetical protein
MDTYWTDAFRIIASIRDSITPFRLITHSCPPTTRATAFEEVTHDFNPQTSWQLWVKGVSVPGAIGADAEGGALAQEQHWAASAKTMKSRIVFFMVRIVWQVCQLSNGHLYGRFSLHLACLANCSFR